MRVEPRLGRVESLFPHVQKEWWRNDFEEYYLRTDGDVADDPAITEAECLEILNIPLIANIFAKTGPSESLEAKTETVQEPTPLKATAVPRVLDLCCGQGRHSINLAQKYPSAEFYGHDQSTYLVNLAKERACAAGCRNISFSIGDAHQIPVDDNRFDLAILMGNSFGYSDDNFNTNILKEIFRVLKPGGIFLLDLPDAEWMRSNISEQKWEWINGGVIGTSDGSKTKDQLTERRLLACRQRELSPQRSRLATRELVIDLERGDVKDTFYAVRIYDLKEMEQLLGNCGFSMQTEDMKQMSRPQSRRDEDLGMMEHRHLVLAQKTSHSDGDLALVDRDVTFYAHPDLVIAKDSYKGRLLSATNALKAGTLLMIDKPYALVPLVAQATGPYLTCSRHDCSRKMMHEAESISCSKECVRDVVWCSDQCQRLDADRHSFECSWLKRNSATIRQKHGDSDFERLWLTVRILAQRHLEMQNAAISKTETQSITERDSPTFGKKDWNAIWNLLPDHEAFPREKMQYWATLAEEYLGNTSALPTILDTQDIVALICKQEVNSFCLFPNATGIFPLPFPPIKRGEPYGEALYTRATLINHSCIPNVTHKPDNYGRMVYHVTRDIPAGEECCIAYFDLAEHVDFNARQKQMAQYWEFTCQCARCIEEGGSRGRT